MTKVCHLSSAHAPNDTRIFHKQCASLAKAGYQVSFVVKAKDAQSVGCTTQKGVQVIQVPVDSSSRLKRMLFGAKAVYQKALEVDADIYEFHDPELLPYGLKLAKKGKKVIFDSHEDYPTQIMEKEWIPTLLRRMISSAYRAYETHVVKQLDAVLFPCTKNGINIFENRAKRVVILSNAVMLEEMTPPQQEVQKPGDTICCTGSLTYQRGITHLIRAAHQAGVKLILAGQYSSEEYRKELEAMPEYSCVEYLGYIGRQELAQVYARSSIGMSTILNVGQYASLDNFPTKVYEYMAAGLPVIVSDYPFMRRSVQQDDFGIAVDPADVQAVAQAIRAILSDPQRAQQMGENGRQAVLQKYNWDIELKKLLELYDSLSEQNS